MLHFLSNWLMNDQLIHNLFLVLFAIWILFNVIVWIVKLIKDRTKDYFSFKKHIKRLITFFIFHFLLGNFILLLIQIKFYRGWLLTGWFFQDLTLWIIYGVMVLSCGLIIIHYCKRWKVKTKKIKGLFESLLCVILAELLIGSFVLFVFNGVGRSVDVQMDSPTIIVETKDAMLSINKMRMVIPNGVRDGVSLSSSIFETIAVDMNTGKMVWNRKSKWQEYIIGKTTNGILMIDSKKKRLYFIDSITGKTSLTEKEWVNDYKSLVDNLSYNYTDYCVKNENEIYLYALDGKYYKVDLNTKRIKENQKYQQVISDSNFHSVDKDDMDEDLVKTIDSMNHMYSDRMNLQFLHIGNRDKRAVITYLEKRNDKQLTVSGVSTEEKKIYWSTKVTYGDENIMYPVMGYYNKNKIYMISSGKQYKINNRTGEIEYIYNYRGNEKVNK